MRLWTNLEALRNNLVYFVRWALLSVLIGLVVGVPGALFRKGIDRATRNWNQHPWMLLLGPVMVILILLWAKLLREEKNGGTNTIIESVTDGSYITLRTAPFIFIATLLSHLAGASVGKEGAALMLGGSLGSHVSRLFRMDDKDQKIAVMCGMSACFAAVFLTPLAATIFPMEMISIGIMYYAALIPCMLAAFVGAGVSSFLGNGGEAFPVQDLPLFDLKQGATVIVFGALAALVAVLFSLVLGNGHRLVNKALPDPFIRAIILSILFIAMSWLNLKYFSRGLDFSGGGFPLVEKAMEGEAPWYAFLFKMLFTAVCIFAGFKGGEIVPTLCIGGCFGALFAGVFGLDLRLYTACGMAALFAGMTNCPISTLLLSFELFGYEGMPWFLMAIAVSFNLSGYYGLYASQRFPYSKTKALYINRKGPRDSWKEVK